MGFWIARARRFGGRALVATLACLIVGASAASAVSVSLPTSIAISAVSQNTSVNMTIGTVSNLEAVAVSFTYDSSIVSVPAGGVTVPAGSLISTCSAPVVNIDNASMPGRVTITLACITAVSGSGTLFSVTFHGLANGTSPLAFSPTAEVLNGCQLNEGTPTCEPSPIQNSVCTAAGVPAACCTGSGTGTCPGQISVGAVAPTSTATATGAATATQTATRTATATATATGTVTATRTATATGTVGATQTATPSATNTLTPPSTATRTTTPTVTDTPTIGPSATASQTRTASSTATVTLTPTTSSTPSISPTATNTPPASSTATITVTRTITATATATPVPTPVITSGAVGGSTRVFGHGAANLPPGGIEIIAVNGNQVIGTGGTNGTGAFFDAGALGIGLSRPLVAGEQIFALDTIDNVTGPTVTVGPTPPTAIPTLDAHGIAALGALLGLALMWRLALTLRRK